jgi:hypothetical protein
MYVHTTKRLVFLSVNKPDRNIIVQKTAKMTCCVAAWSAIRRTNNLKNRPLATPTITGGTPTAAISQNTEKHIVFIYSFAENFVYRQT